MCQEKVERCNLVGWVHTGNNRFQWLYFRAAFKELVRNTARQLILFCIFDLSEQHKIPIDVQHLTHSNCVVNGRL